MEEIIEWLTTNLSAEKLALFGQFLVSGGAITWAVGIYNKFKTQTIKTPDDIAKSVESKIQGAVDNAMKPLNEKIEKVIQNEKVLAESIALLSNEDATSKLALVENISKIEAVDKELIEEIKAVAVEQVEQEAEQEAKVEEAIEELEKPVEFL